MPHARRAKNHDGSTRVRRRNLSRQSRDRALADCREVDDDGNRNSPMTALSAGPEARVMPASGSAGVAVPITASTRPRIAMAEKLARPIEHVFLLVAQMRK
jgi:hypothetical protein